MPEKGTSMMTNDLYKSVLDNLYEGVYFVDLERRITYWNKGAERITGYSAAEIVGKKCADNLLVHIDASGRCLCTADCPLVDVMKQNCCHKADQVYLHHKTGHRVPVSVSISLIRDTDGTPTGAAEVFYETKTIDHDAQLIESLKRETLIDMLTGLPNRRYLQMNLTGALAEFDRHGIGFGLLFIDVDHFKQVNDSYGHDVGDSVLKLVGTTMGHCMRAYDMIGRWGGEEFLAIIRFTDDRQFRLVAEKLRAMVENSFLMHKEEAISVTITMGATQVRPGDTIETLVDRADRLMYKGKQAGRNRVHCS
jgi:diguanylate cyclase (GGDEF)-like protein/PAS domain S-box-containing protein